MVSRLPAGTVPMAWPAAAYGAALPASVATARSAAGPVSARAAGPPAATAIVVAASAAATAAAKTVLDFLIVSLLSRRCDSYERRVTEGVQDSTEETIRDRSATRNHVLAGFGGRFWGALLGAASGGGLEGGVCAGLPA